MRAIESQMPLPPLPRDQMVEGLTFSGTVTSIEAGKVYSQCIFEEVFWQGVDVQQVKFIACRFVGNTFDNTTLSGCLFQNTQFSGATAFVRCWLDGSVFSGVVAGAVAFDACELTANTGHQMRADKLQFTDSALAMNTWTEGQFQKISWTNCKLRDEGLADVKAQTLQAEACHLQRLMVGGLSSAQLEFKHCAGEMVRFFKSQLDKVALRQPKLSQWSMSDCQVDHMMLLGGEMPLMLLQNSIFQRLDLNQAPLHNAMFDGSAVAHMEILLATIRDGSLRQARIERLVASHCVWERMDAKGAQLGTGDFKNVRVEQSDFAGQDERVWSGVDFKNTTFDQKISFEEKQWWSAFRQGAPNVIL